MKKLLVLALSLIMVWSIMLPIQGSSIYSEEENIDLGRVVEVIDGEVVKVFFYRRNFVVPSIETVKIIGIDTEASNEAFEYTTNRLLGKTVYFLNADQDNYTPEAYTHAHIFVDYSKSIAEELLELGYAKVDSAYEGELFYQDMLASEYSAKLYEIGRWQTSLSQSTDRLNINTASSAMLKDTLGIDEDLAIKIMVYRNDNNFNNIHELMAVDKSVNAEWIEEKSHLMSVVTNVNKTSQFELSSLLPESSNKSILLDALEYHLKFNEITDIKQLSELQEFAGYYPQVAKFLTVDVTNVLEEHDLMKVNINTSNEHNFTIVTGLPTYSYNQVLSLKKDDYIIDSLGELTKADALFGQSTSHIYFNHLNVYTDINSAGVFELASLFDPSEMNSIEKKAVAQQIIDGRPYRSLSDLRKNIGLELYTQIRPYIYIYKSDIAIRYNVNTAESEDKDMLDSFYEGRFTRYTNVNTASKRMLLDLNEDMSEALADAIIEYRLKHRFANNDDLKNLFSDYNLLSLHNRIAYYLTYN